MGATGNGYFEKLAFLLASVREGFGNHCNIIHMIVEKRNDTIVLEEKSQFFKVA
jgi:hypothetical protein